MSQHLPAQIADSIQRRGFSRRSFGRFAALMTAGASLPFYNEAVMAQGLSAMRSLPPDAVKINANENPLGPCNEAAEAIYSAVKKGGRYNYEETFAFQKTQADIDGVKPNYVLAYAGSSAPLHYAVMAFVSKDRPLVTADPGYEAAERAAQFLGAKVIKVPLAKDFGQDVKAMATAHPTPGLIYVCNPNNPTGTVTKRSDIEWLIKNKPEGSVVLLDEAYIHLTEETFGSDFVAADKDVVILRTFSKLYGMAGLRAGCAIARPDLLAKIMPFGAGAHPMTGMVGATASLKVKNLVPERRKIIADIRQDTLEFLYKKNFKTTPSQTNCFMVDCGRPGQDVFNAMLNEKVVIGRVWKSWPNHVRVSVGTREEMEKFKAAFTKVMA